MKHLKNIEQEIIDLQGSTVIITKTEMFINPMTFWNRLKALFGLPAGTPCMKAINVIEGYCVKQYAFPIATKAQVKKLKEHWGK